MCPEQVAVQDYPTQSTNDYLKRSVFSKHICVLAGIYVIYKWNFRRPFSVILRYFKITLKSSYRQNNHQSFIRILLLGQKPQMYNRINLFVD